MKDIDFDELDQAVSSVLKTPAEKTEAPEQAVAETVPVAEEKPVDSPVDAADTASASAPATAAEAKTPLAIKRRGQFMDVVHPSSDMTGKPGETPTAPTPKVNIQPISSTIKSEVAAEAPAENAETTTEPAPVESTSSVVPETTVETTPADRTWPDPLDVMETQEEAKDPAAAVESVEDSVVETLVDDEEAPAPPSEEPASETPFLPDTKVDKRPLDAFSPEETAESVDIETAGVPAPAEPLPPELQPDVVAVEANPSDKSDEDDANEAPVSVEKTSTPEPSFNASISQQYVAEENQADEDHSIFDTREYHQPIAPAKVKKRGFPGWLAASLVVLLLAGLGAAGGYFWFYYGI